MPTYQTTPILPWTFPDQAYQMNRKGIQPLESLPLRSMDVLPGVENEAHSFFSSHEHNLVFERLNNNKNKEQGMLGLNQKNARSQRYVRPASRSAVPNGVFHGPANMYAASSGLRGGVITTQEGQSWLSERLKQRALEYGERRSGSFPSQPRLPYDVTPHNDVETLLQAVFTSFTAGSFTSSLNDTLNKLLQALIKIGAIVTSSQISTYARAVEKLMMTSRAYEGDLGTMRGAVVTDTKEKRLRSLDSINNTLRIIDAVIKEIARLIYEPLSTRQQAMNQLQTRLLTRQIGEFKPGFVGEEEGTAFDVERPDLPLGEVRPSRDLLPSRAMPSSSAAAGEDFFFEGPASNLPGLGLPEMEVQRPGPPGVVDVMPPPPLIDVPEEEGGPEGGEEDDEIEQEGDFGEIEQEGEDDECEEEDENEQEGEGEIEQEGEGEIEPEGDFGGPVGEIEPEEDFGEIEPEEDFDAEVARYDQRAGLGRRCSSSRHRNGLRF